MSVISKAVAVLSKQKSASRLDKFHKVVNQRTRNVSLIFENVVDPHNVAACLRTADIFGIQDVHVIEKFSSRFTPNTTISRNAHQWLTVNRYPDAVSCVSKLHSDGFRVLATHVTTETKDLRQTIEELRNKQTQTQTNMNNIINNINSEQSSKQQMSNHPNNVFKLAIAFGNETRGVSAKLLGSVDSTFCLPMYGFTESFNLSVSVGICLSTLQNMKFLEEKISLEEKEKLLFDWLVSDTPLAREILEHNGIQIDDL